MSTGEFTPAVERAAELLIHEAETTGLIREDVRRGLAVALDVEEMARAAHSHDEADGVEAPWDELPEWSRNIYRGDMRAIRASILGQSS